MKIDKIVKGFKEKALKDFDCEICMACKSKKINEDNIYYSCWGYYKNDHCLYHSMMCKSCYSLLKLIE